MDLVLSILAIGLGLLVLAWIAWDIFQTVVVPRPTPTRVRLARHLTRRLWALWRLRAQRARDANDRERMLGSFAPLLVVLLVAGWIVGLCIGFGLLLWALRDEIKPVPDLFAAVYQAGVSVLTIGYGDIVAQGTLSRLVELIAGGMGLFTVALGITYLFSLYGSLQRRERLVTTLDARAGAPPSGVELLATHARLGLVDDLARVLSDWEAWAADVLDTHTAYPILIFFRSSHDSESWISALGAVLDAATLVSTTLEDGPLGQATLTLQVGTHCVEDLSRFLGFGGDGPAMVERAEFDEARGRLAEVGLTLRADADDAWARFAEVRSRYAAPLNRMAAYVMSPPAQWIGDRSVLPHGSTAGR